MFYKIFIRPVFFLFDPESVHNFVLNFVSKFTFLYPLFKIIYSPKKNSEIEICGLKFKNKLGLAAGFDKNGIAIRFWESLGFSHIEIGTVTTPPQPGNNKPRIFRLKKDCALINRLGFNNAGADKVKKNILESKKFINRNFIIGVNIGKNKDTPIEGAFKDYKICFEKMFEVADYFTINISSPNTEGLRKLHEPQYLDSFLFEIQQLNRDISKLTSSSLKCIFLKISPDLTDGEIESIYNSVVKNNLSGIIATNTTIERNNLKTSINEEGGLSGEPLKSSADKVLIKLNELNTKNLDKPVILIGVGGIFSRKDLNDKINSGASLAQIYTGLIYEGPGIIKEVLK